MLLQHNGKIQLLRKEDISDTCYSDQWPCHHSCV